MQTHGDVRSVPRRDIRALTGLRAVAATWVVLLHFTYFSAAYLDQMPFLRPLINAGWTGVELFFVLSGFVITLSYLERIGERLRLRAALDFMWNRFARVWPAWAVVTVLMGAWIWSLRKAGLDADVVTPHPTADVLHLLQQLTMTQMWGRQELPGASYVLPGWSISAEWAAYLVFPVLVVVLFRLRRLPAPVLLALAVAVMAPLSLIAVLDGTPDHQQHWGLRIACGFTAGALAALAVRRTERSEQTDRWALATVWTMLFLIAASAYWASWRRGGDWQHEYVGVVVVFFPLLVTGLALTDRGPSRWLSSGPLVYGGRISYTLYLVHYVVLDVAVTALWQDESRGQMTPLLVLAVPGLVVASFIAAAALHHGVEEPARHWLLRLTRGTVPRAARVPVPAPRTPATALLDVRTAAARRSRHTADRPAVPVLPTTGQRLLLSVATDTRERPVPMSVRPSA
jgi:peptidoglycan/LPS O-acetylase OafA/YrhL